MSYLVDVSSNLNRVSGQYLKAQDDSWDWLFNSIDLVELFQVCSIAQKDNWDTPEDQGYDSVIDYVSAAVNGTRVVDENIELDKVYIALDDLLEAGDSAIMKSIKRPIDSYSVSGQRLGHVLVDINDEEIYR